MNPLPTIFQLQNLHCYDEADGPGDAEPYLWVVYFKIDGDTVVLDEHYKLAGTATVSVRAGNHGDLGDTNVGSGDDVAITSALGVFQTTLRPIPLRVPIGDVTEVGGVIGCVAILMEQDNTPDDAIAKGHQALDAAIRTQLDALIPSLGVTHPEPSQMEIDDIASKVSAAVEDAVRSNVSAWDWLSGFGNMDDVIGQAFFSASHTQLDQDRSVPVRAWWIERTASVTSLQPGTAPPPVRAFRPGRYDTPLGLIAAVTLPRGWRLTVYPQRGFAGPPKVFTQSGAAFAEVESFEIDMGRVVLFAEPDLHGQATELTETKRYDYDAIAPVGNDRTASIAVPDGWRAIAWSEAHFWGDQASYLADLGHIPAPLAGRISSLELQRAETGSANGDWELTGRVYVPPPPPHRLDAHFETPPPPDVAATVTIVARDTADDTPVAGRVWIDGVDVAATNTPFTYTFATRAERRVVWLPPDEVHRKPHRVVVTVHVWLDTIVVKAAGFPDQTIRLANQEDDGEP